MTIDALDLVRIEIATEQHAAGYFGGPLELGQDSAARYVAEGHLGTLCDRYGLGPVWEAVAEVLQQRPELLTLTMRQREQLRQERADCCQEVFSRADVAFRAADYPAALSALDEGERIAPDHQPIDWSSWEDLRQVVARKQAEAQESAAA